MSFGPPEDGGRYHERGEFLEVVPSRRLVFAERVSSGDDQLSDSRTVVEFEERDGSTELILTSEGPGSTQHEAGWGTTLRHLAELLRA